MDALIAEIAVRRPHFVGMSRLLADRATGSTSSASGWFPNRAYGRLTAEDIETLANDPPLPFFILFEAMRQPQAEGLRLGPLGSIIVSEVIFGALERNEIPAGRGADSLADALAEISAEYYPTNVFAERTRN